MEFKIIRVNLADSSFDTEQKCDFALSPKNQTKGFCDLTKLAILETEMRYEIRDDFGFVDFTVENAAGQLRSNEVEGRKDRAVYAEIRGGCEAFARYSLWDQGRSTSLGGLYVRPQFRGYGIGKALVDEVKKHSEEWGSRRIDLVSCKRAIGFYESQGFRVDSTAPSSKCMRFEMPDKFLI